MNDASLSRVLHDGAWVMLGQSMIAIGGFGGARLLIELVPPAVYGTVALWLGILMFARNIFVMPISYAGTRFYPEAFQHNQLPALKHAIAGDLQWSWIASTIVFALSVTLWPISSRLSYIGMLLSVIFVFDAIRTIEFTFLSADRRHIRLALWTAGEALLRPAMGIGAIFMFGRSAISILLGYAIASGCLILLMYQREPSFSKIDGHLTSPDQGEHIQLKHDLRRYALPLMPLAVVLCINAISDRYIIQWQCGTSQVGVYAAAYSLMSIPFLVIQMIVAQTLKPIYLQALVECDRTRASKVFSAWLITVAIGCAIGVIVSYTFANRIGPLLLAPRYQGGIVLLPWIAFGNAIYACGQIFEAYLLAHKQTLAVTSSQAIGALISLVSVIVLVHAIGMKGAAIACPFYYGAIFIIQGVLVYRYPKRHAIRHKPYKTI